MSQAVQYAEDRSLLVPPNMVVKTAWVPLSEIKFACKARMSIGDVKVAYERLLQLGDSAAWPPPNGEWEGEEGNSRFVIFDGRHEYIASQMLGRELILVAWLAEK